MLEAFAWFSIATAFACALWIAIDETRHTQAMAVMNVVWPVSSLYFSVLAVWAYYAFGRKKTRDAMQHGSGHASSPQNGPTLSQVAVGTSHCGAGCMLADIGCEFAIAAAGITLFGSVLWAEYAIDLAAAWSLGIVFQYAALQPMRHLPVGQALAAAIKADTLSILAFQVGMYAWMALTYFVLFPHPHLTPFSPVYWLMMQAAMICGYCTSFPMNRALIRAGWKEAM
ncbi:MAG TPA: DUF4396 domain-containing protein [Terracidiphilus sp.]|nr:DUF4396 domain-containing protein [Terracidiphilus sp.]